MIQSVRDEERESFCGLSIVRGTPTGGVDEVVIEIKGES